MDDPTPARRMTRGLSRALEASASATPKTGAAAVSSAPATAPRRALGERTNTAGAAGVPPPPAATATVTRPAFSPLLPGADTTPPLRLAPEALASPAPARAPFTGGAGAAAPLPSSIPRSLLRRAAPLPPPSTLDELLASPYTPVGDDGELLGPSSIPAHWPRPGEREAAVRAYTSGDGGGPASASSLPPKAVVARAPTPEDAGTDREGVAALQDSVRRALTSVGVVVPPPARRQAYRPPALRAADGEAGEATAPTPGRRLTALEAVFSGLGLRTPGSRRRTRGGGGGA